MAKSPIEAAFRAWLRRTSADYCATPQDAFHAAWAIRDADVERLRDRVFELSAELGYAPDPLAPGGSSVPMTSIINSKPQRFKGPKLGTIRERRLAAERAGWKA